MRRDVSRAILGTAGHDGGGDTASDSLSCDNLGRVLNALETAGNLPRVIIYTLEPSSYFIAATVAGSFRRVTMGAAWWFWDSSYGITRQLDILSSTSLLSNFCGMLSDSRSFLSYTRHDYFRRLLCTVVGRWVDGGEYDFTAAKKLVNAVCFENASALTEDNK